MIPELECHHEHHESLSCRLSLVITLLYMIAIYTQRSVRWIVFTELNVSAQHNHSANSCSLRVASLQVQLLEPLLGRVKYLAQLFKFCF